MSKGRNKAARKNGLQEDGQVTHMELGRILAHLRKSVPYHSWRDREYDVAKALLERYEVRPKGVEDERI